MKIAHPESMAAAVAAAQFCQKTEVINSFEIPREAYLNANLLGGSFTIFVSLRDPLRRMQFGQLGPRVTLVDGKLNYSKAVGGSAAMGTWYNDYYFHIFENGLCYELAFELVEYNVQNADAGCNIPFLSEEDDLSLVKPLIATVAFFRPIVRHARK